MPVWPFEALIAALRPADGGDATDAMADRSAWKSTISGWQEQYPLQYDQPSSGHPLKPQYVVEQLRDHTPDDTIVVAGVGQHQMWASQFWKFDYPYTWVNSGGLGTMGFAVPAAIGAKVGQPDRTVWAVDGDGCFQMTAQELISASAENIPVKVAILNNAYLGMVRQWQELLLQQSAIARCTSALIIPTTWAGPRPWAVRASGWSRPRKSRLRSRKRTRSMTGPW